MLGGTGVGTCGAAAVGSLPTAVADWTIAATFAARRAALATAGGRRGGSRPWVARAGSRGAWLTRSREHL